MLSKRNARILKKWLVKKDSLGGERVYVQVIDIVYPFCEAKGIDIDPILDSIFQDTSCITIPNFKRLLRKKIERALTKMTK